MPLILFSLNFLSRFTFLAPKNLFPSSSAEMQKLVVKSDIHDEKHKKKAMKAVSSISGIDSISVDMKNKKITVTGNIDPVQVVGKLRKTWHTDIETVGPVKEPEKKKEEPKKEGAKKPDDPKKTESQPLEELVIHYPNYNAYTTQHYVVYSAEENPNSCGIF